MSTLKLILLTIWQIPQILVGLLMLPLMKVKHTIVTEDNVFIFYASNMHGGISLGRIIFLNTSILRKTDEECMKRTTVKHELGHCVQSRYLGWLYLFIVGIPSFCWAALHTRFWKEKSYYSFYTEKWADRIAGIKR